MEQAHASAACLHKMHPSYELTTLSSRATLHQCRHLFLSSPEAAKEAKHASHLATLKNKDPHKVSGRHAFLAFVMEQGKLTMPPGSKLSPFFVKQLMQQHSRWFAALPLADQRAFHNASKAQAEARSKVKREDISHFQAAMHLHKIRKAQELQSSGVKNTVTSARFEAEDYQRVDALMSSSDFPAGNELRSMRQESLSAPQVPPPGVIAALQRCPTFAAPVPAVQQADWLKDMCWHRDSLSGVAFATSFHEGSDAYYFLYAAQSRLVAHFLPITIGKPVWPCLEGLSYADFLAAWGGYA